MKRKLTRLLVTLLVALTVMGAVPAFAAEVEETNHPNATVVEAQEGSVVTRAEEKGYVYREHNGWIQRRLWSYTYAKWLTDWENTAPAPKS